MHIELAYGKTGLGLDLPDGWPVTVVRKKTMPVCPDPAAAVRCALAAPVEARPLEQEARGGRSACVLVCDITRPVPNGLILPAVVEALERGGIPRRRLTILVATGLHRPNVGAELRELIGDASIAAGVRIVNHDARCEADHAGLGTTSQGIPIRLDRRFLEAEVRVVTGLVEPHFMAGYSGGRKVIAPGIAHVETIARLHGGPLLADPRAASGVLDGNPLHAAQLEIAARVGRVLAVNAVLDERRRLSAVTYGGLVPSHARAVEFLRGFAEVVLPEPFPTVLTSSAGYPLDATYYQTVKAMVGAAPIVAPGGHLFVASACSQGLGSPDFAAAQRRLVGGSPEQFLASALSRPSAEPDEWETHMLLRARRAVTLHLYAPALSDEDRRLTAVEPVAGGLAHAVLRQAWAAGDRRLAIIPEGPYVMPVLAARRS